MDGNAVDPPGLGPLENRIEQFRVTGPPTFDLLRAGRVVQQGTFAALARHARLFAQLMARQAGENHAPW